MKSTYYFLDTIEDQALELYLQVEGYRQQHDSTYAPNRSALLVLDMQTYFLDPASHAYIPSAPAILPGIRKLVESYSERGLPIFFTRHINTAADAGMMSSWWRDLITADHVRSEIVPELESSTGVVIHKSQYDAFFGTQLEDLLRGQEVSQVLICGVMTHLCCETTARSAFVRGFEVFFTVDGTATYNEQHHSATLLNLSHGFATPILVQEALFHLGSSDGD
jgi:isochorismate hydrolase